MIQASTVELPMRRQNHRLTEKFILSLKSNWLSYVHTDLLRRSHNESFQKGPFQKLAPGKQTKGLHILFDLSGVNRHFLLGSHRIF